MVYVLCSIAFLAGLGGVASARARKEVPVNGRVTNSTFVLMFLAFFGAGVCGALAARAASWPLPISNNVALWVGIGVCVAGIALIVASRMYFTFRRAWGLDFDKLITQGVYRWSRNPQVVGWFLLYLGVGFAGRSAAGMTIAFLILLTFVPWIHAEERALERRFGDEYRRYRERTRRFV